MKSTMLHLFKQQILTCFDVKLENIYSIFEDVEIYER